MVNISEVLSILRVDAEPYTPEYLALARTMQRLQVCGAAKTIGEIASVEYGYMPMEDYADEIGGEPLIRVTNIKNQLKIELDDVKYVAR
jgi:type I restriction enzyme S subunit